MVKLRWSALGAAALLALGLAAAEAREVRVYNWSDYIAPEVLAEFTAETGIRVVYDTYDSNDMLETRLFIGRTGYDVVVPTSTYLARQVQAGVLMPLDRSKLPNLRHMDPELMARLAKYDPGNAHAVIYMWGTTGIGLNPEPIRRRMPEPPANSLAMLFDPDAVSRFADCGVSLLDAPDEIIPAALTWLGEDPDSKEPSVLRKAEEHLLKIRPHIRRFHSSQYINDLANGDICLAFGWSGDILQAKARAEEAGGPVRVQYLLPREGALMWFDTLAIPRDAPNPDAAHAFIDFLMRPQVIARISEEIQYPNGNRDALEYISAETMRDRDVWPTPEAMRRLYTISPNTQPQQRLFNRIWTRVKGAS